MSEKKKIRIMATAAGYMELDGARKDGDCQVVEAPGGISRDKGCCNNFWPPTAKAFKCGACDYVAGAGEYSENAESKPLGKKEARGMSFKDILESQRPVLEGREEE